MKNRVLTVSLSLLACLCCCFSGFGSVRAFANYSFDEWYNTQSPNGVFAGMYLKSGYDSYTWKKDAVVISDGYLQTGTGGFNGQCVSLIDIFFGDSWMPILNHNNYDYYLGLYVSSVKTSTFSIDWSSDTPELYYGNGGASYVNGSTDNYTQYDTTLISSSIYTGSNNLTGWSYLFKLPSDFSTLGLVRFNNISGFNSNFKVGFFLYQVDKSNGDISSIVDAINNQTNHLSSDIGQAADDVQQSIEDQYQMEDEEDFGFSDIQQQYEEKMGVLTFGTETTIQMLELFSPSNAGEAYIRVPGWSMDVQGETYQIWDEYVFYFDSIEENFPFLVTTMRTFTVAMFYVSIVGYITKVYERNFLAK